MGKKGVKVRLVSGPTLDAIAKKFVELEQKEKENGGQRDKAKLDLLDKFSSADIIWSKKDIDYSLPDPFPVSLADVDRVKPLWGVVENKNGFCIEREKIIQNFNLMKDWKPRTLDSFPFSLVYDDFDKLKYKGV